MWFRLDSSGSGFRELFSASSNSSDTELEFYINGSNELRAGLKGTYHNFSGGSTSPVVAAMSLQPTSAKRTFLQLASSGTGATATGAAAGADAAAEAAGAAAGRAAARPAVRRAPCVQ